MFALPVVPASHAEIVPRSSLQKRIGYRTKSLAHAKARATEKPRAVKIAGPGRKSSGMAHGAQGRDGPHRQQILLFRLLTTSSTVSFVPQACASSTSFQRDLRFSPTVPTASSEPQAASNWFDRTPAKGQLKIYTISTRFPLCRT